MLNCELQIVNCELLSVNCQCSMTNDFLPILDIYSSLLWRSRMKYYLTQVHGYAEKTTLTVSLALHNGGKCNEAI